MNFLLQIHRETETFYSVDASRDAGLQEKKSTSVSSGNQLVSLQKPEVFCIEYQGGNPNVHVL